MGWSCPLPWASFPCSRSARSSSSIPPARMRAPRPGARATRSPSRSLRPGSTTPSRSSRRPGTTTCTRRSFRPASPGSNWTAESTWKLNDGGTPAMKYEGGDVRWCATFRRQPTRFGHVTARGIVRNHYGTAATTTRQLSAADPDHADRDPAAAEPGVELHVRDPHRDRERLRPHVLEQRGDRQQRVRDGEPLPGQQRRDQLAEGDRARQDLRCEQRCDRHVAGTNNWSTRVEVQVGGAGGQFCKYATGAWTTISSSPFCGDAQHVYSKNSTSSAMTVNPTPAEHRAADRRLAGLVRGGDPGPEADVHVVKRHAPGLRRRHDAEQQHRHGLRPDAGELELQLPRRPLGDPAR